MTDTPPPQIEQIPLEELRGEYDGNVYLTFNARKRIQQLGSQYRQEGSWLAIRTDQELLIGQAQSPEEIFEHTDIDDQSQVEQIHFLDDPQEERDPLTASIGNALIGRESQVDKARYLTAYIRDEIIESDGYVVERSTPKQLIDHYEKYQRSTGRRWREDQEVLHRLEEIHDSLDIGSSMVAKYLRAYKNASNLVLKKWEQEALSYRQVEQLNGIHTKLSKSPEQPKPFEEYVENTISNNLSSDELRSRKEAIPDKSEPTISVNSEEIKEFRNNLSSEQAKMIEEIAEEKGVEEKTVSKSLLKETKNGGDEPQEQLKFRYEQLRQKQQKREKQEEERAERIRKYDFEATPFTAELSDGEQPPIKDMPLVLNPEGEELSYEDGYELEDIEVGVFFHDNQYMDLEFSEEEVFHLFFFSPPYFDQSGTMPVKQWLPTGVDEIADEATLDATYENYLEWLIERIKIFAEKLKPGRVLAINVSDTSTSKIADLDERRYGSAPDKYYPIPESLAHRIAVEIEDLYYEPRLIWQKIITSQNRGGAYWSQADEDIAAGRTGFPLQYYPQAVTEDVLIFRKGQQPDHKDIYEEAAARFDDTFDSRDEFQWTVGFEDPEAPFRQAIDEKENVFFDSPDNGQRLEGEATGSRFDDPRTNVWKIEPESEDWEHTAGFPLALARLVIDLFTLPGERIADPFGGYSTTLKAVQKVNQSRPEMPPRQGFAWENFSSEQIGKEDYRQKVSDKLRKTGLAGFRT